VGAIAFLMGVGFPLAVADVETYDTPEYRLFQINAGLGFGIMYVALGGFLVVQAAAALGGTSSGPMPLRRWPWVVLPFFPLAVVAGQFQATHPERLPWIFPLVNIIAVGVPSLAIAAIAARRYLRLNPLAWPVSWREWTSGIIYGAIGATTMALIFNSLYIELAGRAIADAHSPLDTGVLELDLALVPRNWGIFFDLSVLSVFVPFNEELWKGLLVAWFFFRKGRLGRVFLWGVLAGAGFNLVETFQNSLGAVSPEALADQAIGSEWWFFAIARVGTALIHALATGLAAVGFWAMFRRRWRLCWGYPAGALLHGTWNLLVYTVWGDAELSRSGPDSRLLDVVGGLGMVAVAAASAFVLWRVTGALRDDSPAPIYAVLGMRPARGGEPTLPATMAP
jgi:hypothetical protein